MRGHHERHVEDRLQAWLDGELAEVEAESVRSHLDKCESCSGVLEQAKVVLGALKAAADTKPLRPMWPAVKASAFQKARPRFGLSFGLATSLAAAAGLVLGLALGSPVELPQQSEVADSSYTESMLGDDDVMTLDQIYVSVLEKAGDSE